MSTVTKTVLLKKGARGVTHEVVIPAGTGRLEANGPFGLVMGAASASLEGRRDSVAIPGRAAVLVVPVSAFARPATVFSVSASAAALGASGSPSAAAAAADSPSSAAAGGAPVAQSGASILGGGSQRTGSWGAQYSRYAAFDRRGAAAKSQQAPLLTVKAVPFVGGAAVARAPGGWCSWGASFVWRSTDAHGEYLPLAAEQAFADRAIGLVGAACCATVEVPVGAAVVAARTPFSISRNLARDSGDAPPALVRSTELSGAAERWYVAALAELGPGPPTGAADSYTRRPQRIRIETSAPDVVVMTGDAAC